MKKIAVLFLFVSVNLWAGKFSEAEYLREPTWQQLNHISGSYVFGKDTTTWKVKISSTGEIIISTISARDNEGIYIMDNGGNIFLYMEDGGNIGIGTTDLAALLTARAAAGITIFGYNDTGTGGSFNGGTGTGVSGFGDTRGGYFYSLGGSGLIAESNDTVNGAAATFLGKVYAETGGFVGLTSSATWAAYASSATFLLGTVYHIYVDTAAWAENSGKLNEHISDFFVDTITVQNIGGKKTFEDMVTISSKTKISVASGGALEAGHSACSATGNYAVALAENATASGSGSLAALGGTSSGANSLCLGDSLSSGNGSKVIGSGCVVDGLFSMALLRRIKVTGDYSLGIGLDNTTRAFGNNNTMAIMGGWVGIDVATPTVKLDVDGEVRAGTFTATGQFKFPDNTVMTSTTPFATDAEVRAATATLVTEYDLYTATNPLVTAAHDDVGWSFPFSAYVGNGVVYRRLADTFTFENDCFGNCIYISYGADGTDTVGITGYRIAVDSNTGTFNDICTSTLTLQITADDETGATTTDLIQTELPAGTWLRFDTLIVGTTPGGSPIDVNIWGIYTKND